MYATLGPLLLRGVLATTFLLALSLPAPRLAADPINFSEPTPTSDATTPLTTNRISIADPALRAESSPGRVEIAPYGEFEDKLASRPGGYLAVRFDLFFDVRYTITAIRFPSYTYDGAPATFPSVRLCDADPVNGKPMLATPLFQAAPFTGSPDGWNEIPVDVGLPGTDRTLYVCVEFPEQTPDFPYSYPFLRMDITDLDRGLFGASYGIRPTGSGGMLADRNLILSLVCQLSDPGATPIESSSNLGANRISTGLEYSFRPPSDVRADGYPMPRNSLRGMNLYYRPQVGFEPWRLWVSKGAGVDRIDVDSFPFPFCYWTTQAVDREGHRAILSDVIGVTYPYALSCFGSDVCFDNEEPNGRKNEATLIVPPLYLHYETIFPAGDQDFYEFAATPGDTIYAAALALGAPTYNKMHLIMYLLDQSGATLAFSDHSAGSPLNPEITFIVPREGRFSGQSSRRFTIHVADLYGSPASPDTAPRLTILPVYGLTVRVSGAGSAVAANGAASTDDTVRFAVVTTTQNGGGARFAYSVPTDEGGGDVRIDVFDVQGRLLRTVIDGPSKPGPHVVAWDGRDRGGRVVSAGVYFARLRVGSVERVQRVVILR